MTDLKTIISTTDNYNLHAHSQFCDGRDPMELIAKGACEAGMKFFGFTPHSPICIASSCNMSAENISTYFAETEKLKEKYADSMEILRSLEIDYLGSHWGAHTDYFQDMPLDYRLSSVHFVPNRSGKFYDCDGNFSHFSQVLHEGFNDDIRYVVEKYFEQVLLMMESGGFELLGHFDKIAHNASQASSGIENEEWYESYINDIIDNAKSSGVLVEINTKAYLEHGRFFPSQRWWSKLIELQIPIAVNSDAHYQAKVSSGRKEAFEFIKKIKEFA